jgi:uncharacterized membrane protein
MRRQLHRRWMMVVVGSGLALLLGSWGAVPVLAAQNPQNPAGAKAGGEPPEAYSPIQIVAAVLALSDDQVHALVQVLTAKAAAIQPLVEQIQQHEQEIATLLGGNHPDPAQLGRLLIETAALQAQVQTISAASAAQFVSVLSDPQRQTLGQVRQASQVCPAVPAFAAAGLL